MSDFKFTVLVALSVTGAFWVGYLQGENSWKKKAKRFIQYLGSEKFAKDLDDLTKKMTEISNDVSDKGVDKSKMN